MYSDYGYGGYGGYGGRTSTSTAIILILAVIAGIVLYCTFLSRKNEGKFHGFLGLLYEGLSFQRLFTETVLRIAYIITVIYLVVSGLFLLLSGEVVISLVMIIGGNIAARLMFEAALIILIICRNTTEINKKLGGKASNISFDPIQPEIKKEDIISGIKKVENKFSQPQKTNSEPTKEMKTCSNCGKELEADAVFCVHCGTKMNNE